MEKYDVAIVGGGCIGVSVGKHLVERSDFDVCVLEKEYRLAEHQSGRNSGIVKPGFNFTPGSLRAELTIEGTRRMKQFHQAHGLPYHETGVTLVGNSERDAKRLYQLQEEAEKNRVETSILNSPADIRAVEPHATGNIALHCPEAATIDSQLYLYTLANQARQRGLDMYMGHEVTDITRSRGQYSIRTSNGTIACDYLLNTAGLYADKIAHSLGVGETFQIIPFRGEYFELVPEKTDLVQSMIYPTPDPELPFLGVHFTRRADGKVLLGPNAVLSFGKEAYNLTDVDFTELVETLRYPGFWRLLGSKKMLKVSLGELHKSLRKKRFMRDARELVPEVGPGDVRRSYSGVRSQLVRSNGELVKQPTVIHEDDATHVLQTAWMTSSLPFGDMLSEEILRRLGA